MTKHFKNLIKRNLLGFIVTILILMGVSVVVYAATTIGSSDITVGGSATSTIVGDGTTTTIGGALDVNGRTSSTRIVVESTSTFNNSASSEADFRLKGTNDDGLIYADVSENQVVIHGDSDPNYGSLFVQGRTSGGGADNDISATLGEDDEDIQLNGNNTGVVQNVQIQAGNWTSNNSVSPNRVANLRIEGVPTFGPNVTPNNVYYLLIENRGSTSTIFSINDSNQVGIGTSTPDSALQVTDTSTSTVTVGEVGVAGCLKMRNADNSGWTYLHVAAANEGFSTTTAANCGQ